MANYLLLISGWAIYFFLHSGLASTSVKAFFGRYEWFYSFYRLFYTIISTVGLFLLLAFKSSFQQEMLFPTTGWVLFIGLMVALVGVVIIIRSFRYYNMMSFIGFKREDQNFIRSGILNRVRHPIYSGTILIVLSFFLFTPTLPTLVSVACIYIYLPIGIMLEERKLIRQFGDSYRTYKREVPALLPRIWSGV